MNRDLTDDGIRVFDSVGLEHFPLWAGPACEIPSSRSHLDRGLYRRRWNHTNGFGFVQSTAEFRCGTVWSQLITHAYPPFIPESNHTVAIFPINLPVRFFCFVSFWATPVVFFYFRTLLLTN